MKKKIKIKYAYHLQQQDFQALNKALGKLRGPSLLHCCKLQTTNLEIKINA